MKRFLEHHFNDSIIGRFLCLLFGHVSDQVWMNAAFGLEAENPDRVGVSQPNERWSEFGGGDVFLCPRCRAIFHPKPRKAYV